MHFDLNGFGRRRSSVSASLLVLLSVTLMGDSSILMAVAGVSLSTLLKSALKIGGGDAGDSAAI